MKVLDTDILTLFFQAHPKVNSAVALARNATLVTRNLKDFKRVPGLRIENWAD